MKVGFKLRYSLRVCIGLMMFASLRISYADSEKDFTRYYVKDFKHPSDSHRMTPVKQEKLAGRRRGTYAVELGHANAWFSLPSGPPKKLFINISGDHSVKMYFEDCFGQFVSCPELLTGRFSDECFYWGDLESGVAVRYGVLRDVMPILISPHQKQIALVLKRQGECDKPTRIQCVSALWGLCVIRDRLDDLFDRVCETGQDAKEIRYSVDNGERSFSSKMVACYVSCPDDSKGEAGGSGDGESRVYQYIVLKKGGEYCRIVGDGKNAFRCQPYLLLEWWREFTGASPFGSELVYAVDRDRIVQVRTPFLLSRSLDEMAVSPKFFERPSSEKDKRTRSQMVEVLIDELLREPKKMFARKAFTRISDTPENKELRQKLYDATRLPGD